MISEQFLKNRYNRTWLFRIGIVFKGLNGLAEFNGRFLFVFFSHDTMSDFVERNTHGVLR